MTSLTNSLSNLRQDILEVCRDIRLTCAELYHYYADLYVLDRAAFIFWKRIAMGEENHAKEFTLIAKLKRQNIIHTVGSDPIDAEIALIYLRSIIEKTRQNPPSVEEALSTSIKLEEILSPFHLQNIVAFTDSSFRKQFTKVIQAEQERIATFRKAYEQLVPPRLDYCFQCDLTI